MALRARRRGISDSEIRTGRIGVFLVMTVVVEKAAPGGNLAPWLSSTWPEDVVCIVCLRRKALP